MISIRRLLCVVFMLVGSIMMFKYYSDGLLLLIVAGLMDISDILIWKTK